MKFCLDRIENGIAVCLCEDAGRERERYEFALDRVPMMSEWKEGTLFEAVLGEDGLLYDIRVLCEETDERRARNRARLQALFAKSKRKN